MSRLAERLQPLTTAGAGRRPPRLPRVTVAVGAAVPVWLLRLVVVAAATGALALVASDRIQWVIAGMLIGVIAIWPDSAAAGVFAVGIGLLLLTSAPEPFHPRVFLLAFALHLTLELGAVLGQLPGDGRVEVRALRRAARPFLTVQALAQALALLGAWVSARPATVPWLPLVAAVALAALAWAVTARLRR